MGIDDISGKVSAFWVRAKSALSAAPAETPPPSQSPPRANGDSADLAHKGQYFAGYAFPEPADLPASEPQAPRAANSPEPGAKVWAPLVIKPFESPES